MRQFSQRILQNPGKENRFHYEQTIKTRATTIMAFTN